MSRGSGRWTERLFAITGAVHITSPFYPELERYYQRVGGNYVQTGEIFRLESRPEGGAG